VLLTIDVGNSNVKVGVFDGDELLARWRLETDRQRMPDEYAVLLRSLLDLQGIRMEDITGFSLSSTVPLLTRSFRELSERYYHLTPVVSSPRVNTGIVLAVDNPHEVGPDRIVLGLGAMRRHRVPAIVLDLGTATTCDAISERGELLGCAIAPGMNTALEGLVSRAARLFSVELKAPKRAIGRHTVASVQSGAVFGYVGLVEGLVKRFKTEMGGSPTVIATGGLAPIISEETDVVDVADPDLTLHGLRFLYELNAEPTRPAAALAPDTGD
jgi:type III pantothenate kinase